MCFDVLNFIVFVFYYLLKAILRRAFVFINFKPTRSADEYFDNVCTFMRR